MAERKPHYFFLGVLRLPWRVLTYSDRLNLTSSGCRRTNWNSQSHYDSRCILEFSILNETQWGSSLVRMEAIESGGEKYSKYSTIPSPPSLPADHILLTADADVDKYQEHTFLMNLSICLNAHISFRL